MPSMSMNRVKLSNILAIIQGHPYKRPPNRLERMTVYDTGK